MNKTFVWLPIAFVLGGLAGAWMPTEELRELHARGMDRRPAERQPRAVGGFGDFASLVNIPDRARRVRSVRREPPPAASSSAPEREGPPEAETPPSVAAEAKRPAPPPKLRPEDLRARIDEAAEIWRTRVDIAKAAMLERLAIAPADVERVEAALDAMNSKLRDSMQTIADDLAGEGKMTIELGVLIMGDLSATMAATYDELGEIAGPEMRSEVADLNLIDFVDPAVAEPLIDVQDKLDGFRPGGMSRR